MKTVKRDQLAFITTFYLLGCVLQNILATKTFAAGGFSITSGGTLISWAVFACMDIITELQGKRKAILTFTLGLAINLMWSSIAAVAIALPGNNPYIAECYAVILGSGWRITIASAVAFWIGNYINASIMVNMRRRDGERRFCLRAVLSTLAGQIVDNAVFYLMAFSPLGISGTVEMPFVAIAQMVVTTTALETVIEAVVSPITRSVAREVGGNVD